MWSLREILEWDFFHLQNAKVLIRDSHHVAGEAETRFPDAAKGAECPFARLLLHTADKMSAPAVPQARDLRTCQSHQRLGGWLFHVTVSLHGCLRELATV